ncbi:hypothetical protein [Streptosporangium sp. NPDC000509]|uniref:hypothetical protein n=1 Tax=Streptosporangium sp. NPDC000509 TaxID=3366186 RepID=UPI0036CC588B
MSTPLPRLVKSISSRGLHGDPGKRGDIVNAHGFGMNAYGAPVYHLRRMREEGLLDAYATSFEAVWKQSRLPGEER